MIEKVTIGATPWGESCAQVGSPDYQDQSFIECTVFRRQLMRNYPVPEGVPASIIISSERHDFGTYREVAVRFNPESQAATEYAYTLENAGPENWDSIARYELIWYSTKATFMRRLRLGQIDDRSVPSVYQPGHPPESLKADATLNELLAATPLIF